MDLKTKEAAKVRNQKQVTMKCLVDWIGKGSLKRFWNMVSGGLAIAVAGWKLDRSVA